MILAYTSIIDSYDSVRYDIVNFSTKVNKCPIMSNRFWKWNTQKLNKRIYPHDISVYMDGNIVIRDIDLFVEKYLTGYDDMALFIHQDRKCVYDEADAVKRYGKESFGKVDRYIKHLNSINFKKNRGLTENGILIRRNNARVNKLNTDVWKNIQRFTKRDQLVLPPILNKSGLNINFINENLRSNEFVTFIEHL